MKPLLSELFLPCCGMHSPIRANRYPLTTITGAQRASGQTHSRARSHQGDADLRADINREVSDPQVSDIRPIFVAALAAAMLPACTQSCDALSSRQEFPIATDLFAHPMSIYWRDGL